jgi:tetratricopeptide (TPR) repeat protein
VVLRLTDPWSWWAKNAPKESVRYHWEQANLASDKGDVELAKTHLEAVLATCPLNAQVQFFMARTCRRANDPIAEQYLNLAESLGWPRDQILLEQRLLQAETGDTWSVEEALLKQLNRLGPEERLILEGLIKGYLNSARFADAADFATTWVKRYPGDWEAYLFRGRAYQGQGRLSEAASNYQEALRIQPDAIAARLWYADTLMASYDYRNALDNYQIYRQAVPDDRETLLAIAKCQFSLGQPEVARTAVEKLLKEHSHDRAGLLLAAQIDLAEDAPDKALVRLREARDLGPPDPGVLRTMIRALRKLSEEKEADDLERQNAQILEKAELLRDLMERIQVDSSDVSLRYRAGMVALELGQEKDALGLFQTVLFIEPSHRPTHLALADYWSKHGQPQQAEYHRRKAEGK